MFVRTALIICSLALVPLRATAQHAGGAAAPATTAPKEASQFDFLIGQWELTVRPKVSGLAATLHGAPKFSGTWKAWRAVDGFGIEDELRIIDASANPRSLTHAVRVYDPASRRWSSSVLDVYRATFNSSVAEWKGTEMVATARSTDGDGKPTLTRTRYFDIKPGSFRYQQDRSSDDGKTWDEGVLKIEAKRSAAAAAR